MFSVIEIKLNTKKKNNTKILHEQNSCTTINYAFISETVYSMREKKKCLQSWNKIKQILIEKLKLKIVKTKIRNVVLATKLNKFRLKY